MSTTLVSIEWLTLMHEEARRKLIDQRRATARALHGAPANAPTRVRFILRVTAYGPARFVVAIVVPLR